MTIKNQFKTYVTSGNQKMRVDGYTINKNHKTGFCRIQIDGMDCYREAKVKGLCPSHYEKAKRLNRFDEWTLANKEESK